MISLMMTKMNNFVANIDISYDNDDVDNFNDYTVDDGDDKR